MSYSPSIGFSVDSSEIKKAKEEADFLVDSVVKLDRMAGRAASSILDMARNSSRAVDQLKRSVDGLTLSTQKSGNADPFKTLSSSINGLVRKITKVKTAVEKIVDNRVTITVIDRGVEEVRRKIEAIGRLSPSISIAVNTSSLDSLVSSVNSIENKIIRVSVEADDSAIDKVVMAMESLHSSTVRINIEANTSAVIDTIDAINSVNNKSVAINIAANDSVIDTVKASLESIKDKTVNVYVDIDDSNISSLNGEINSIKDSVVDIGVNIDDSGIYDLSSALDSLHDKTVLIDVIANQSSLDNLISSLSGLSDRDISINVTTDEAAVSSIAARISNIRDRSVSINASANDREVVQLSHSLNEVDRSAGNASRGIAGITTALSAISVGGIALLTNEFIENSKEVARNAATFEMSYQEMQLWNEASEGVIRGGLDMGEVFQDINDKMGDFLITGAGGAIDIFERLNIEFDQVRDKSPADVLQHVVDKMDDLGNVSKKERTFLLEGLASDASKLLPLLEDNGKAFKALIQSAKENFTLLSPSQLDVVKLASSEMTDLKKSFAGLGQQAGVIGSMFVSAFARPIANAFRSVSEYLSDTDNAANLVKIAMSTLSALAVPAIALITAGLWGAVAAGVAFALTPFGAIITALSLAAGAVVYFGDEIVTMGGTTASVMDWVLGAFDYVADGIKRFTANISTAFAIVSNGSSVFEVMGMMMNAMLDVGKNVINGLIGFFVGGAAAMSAAFSALPTAIYNIFASIYNSTVGTINSMVTAMVQPLNALITAVGGTAISVGNTFTEMEKKTNTSGANISKAFSDAFDADYVGDFADAVGDSFSSIARDVGDFAEDRSLDRALDSADKSFKKLDSSVVKTSKAVNAYVKPADDAKKATKELSASEKEAVKQADDLASSQAELAKSFNDSIDALKREQIAVNATEIAMFKYDIANKKIGTSNLAYTESQKLALIKEKERLISLKLVKQADEDAAAAVKDHSDKIKEITKSYADELAAARLNNIEAREGVLARERSKLAIQGVKSELISKLIEDKKEAIKLNEKTAAINKVNEARKSAIEEVKKEAQELALMNTELTKGIDQRRADELAIDGIKGALSEKLVLDMRENDALSEVNKSLEENISKRNSALDAVKDQKRELSLLVVEYDQNAAAASKVKKEIEGLTSAEALESIAIQDSIEKYEDLISQREKDAELVKKVSGEIDDLTKKQELQTIGLTLGTTAQKEAELVTKGYSVSQAELAVSLESSMDMQKELYDAVYDSLSNASSVKDVFSSLGDWLKNWLKDMIVKFATNKIMVMMGGGDTGGLLSSAAGLLGGGGGGGGDLISSAIGLFTGGGSTGGIISSITGAFSGGLAGLGTSVTAGISSIAGVFSGGMASIGTAVTGGLGALGGSVAALVNPVTAALLVGGLILKDFFKKGKVQATLGSKAEATETNDWRDGWYNSSKRAEGVDFTRTTELGQVGLLGDRKSIHIGRDDENQVADITAALDAIASLDNQIASFLPDGVITNIKNNLDGLESNAIDMEAATRERLGVIFSSIPNELNKLIDADAPIEDIVARVNEIAYASEMLTPALKGLGIELGNNEISVTASTVAIMDAGGGATEFSKKLSLFSKSFGDSTNATKDSYDGLISGLSEMNLAIGSTKESSIDTVDSLNEFVSGLDITSQSGIDASSAAMSLSSEIQALNDDLGLTGESAITSKEGLENLVSGLDLTTEAGRETSFVASELIAGFDNLNSSFSITSGSAIATKEGMLAYAQSLDLTTEAGIESFAAILQYQEGLLVVAAMVEESKPLFDSLGLSVGETDGKIAETILSIIGMNGGIEQFSSQMTSFTENFSDNSIALNEAIASDLAALGEMNTSLGLTGDAVITTKQGMIEFSEGLDLTTEAGQIAFSTALNYQDALLGVIEVVTELTPSFMGLTGGMGDSREEITKTITELAAFAGGTQELKSGLNSFYNEFYSQEERKNMALVESAMAVDSFRKELDATQIKLLDDSGFRVFVEGMDKTTDEGKKAFVASLNVAESMAAISESGQSLNEIMKSAPEGFLEFQNSMTGSTDKAAEGIRNIGDASLAAKPAIDSVEEALGDLTSVSVPEGLNNITASTQSTVDGIANISAASASAVAPMLSAETAILGVSVSAERLVTPINAMGLSMESIATSANQSVSPIQEMGGAMESIAVASSNSVSQVRDVGSALGVVSTESLDAAYGVNNVGSALSALASRAVRAAAALNSAATASGGGSASAASGGASASAAVGLVRVPRDNYLVNTHEGEAIVDSQSVKAISRYFNADVRTTKTTASNGSGNNTVVNELKNIRAELAKIKEDQATIGNSLSSSQLKANDISSQILESTENKESDRRLNKRLEEVM